MWSETAAKPPYRKEVKPLHPVPTAISAGLTAFSSLYMCLLRRLCAPFGAWLVCVFTMSGVQHGADTWKESLAGEGIWLEVGRGWKVGWREDWRPEWSWDVGMWIWLCRVWCFSGGGLGAGRSTSKDASVPSIGEGGLPSSWVERMKNKGDGRETPGRTYIVYLRIPCIDLVFILPPGEWLFNEVPDIGIWISAFL